ncbi:MAG TPA: hypothetical protein VM008_08495 [Phycisphaerae bacterium]|nr:hypothetical protein [Phycisphaerae bacterium]
MHDVDPQLYKAVIREMLRHENDVTNHRIMWLLIVQGLIANAAVTAGRESVEIAQVFAAVGILVTLSAFALLYKSYQARGYLQFLGGAANRGSLQEEDLPLTGWPRHRIKGWRSEVWLCPWLGQASDLVEPYLFLPSLLVLAWLFILLRSWLNLGTGMLLVVSTLLTAGVLALLCILWVWWQWKDEVPPNERTAADDTGNIERRREGNTT